MMSSQNAAILREDDARRGVGRRRHGKDAAQQHRRNRRKDRHRTHRPLERPKGPRRQAVNDGKPWRGGYRDNAIPKWPSAVSSLCRPQIHLYGGDQQPQGRAPWASRKLGYGTQKTSHSKLYARGKLTENPEFQGAPAAERTAPVVYSSFDPSRWQQLHRDLDIARTIKAARPRARQNSGTVPDVARRLAPRGPHMPRAHGYAVDFNGGGIRLRPVPRTRSERRARHKS